MGGDTVFPTLFDVKYVHETYKTTFCVGFHTKEAADKAAALTGWDYWDDDTVLEAVWHEDLIAAGGSYYGDWELVEDSDPVGG